MAINLQSTATIASSGVKVLVYGQAGAGKTTLIKTAPAPLILSAEAGLLSLAGTDIPFIEIHSIAELGEVGQWITQSKEAAQFKTICLDSISEIAEVCLSEAKQSLKDGRAAYGEMAEQMSKVIRAYRDIPGRNIYFTAKMDKSDSKDAVKAMQLNAFMAEAKHVESSLVYLKTNPLYEEDRYAFFMTVLEFKDVDDADDFFDDTIDLWEETSDDVEFDDEDKLTQAYVCLEDDDLEVYAGVYKNGNRVLYVVDINAEDELDDACEAFNVNSPTSVK